MDEILVRAVEELDEKTVMEIVKDWLQSGLDPFYIQEQIFLGMKRVGSLYEQGEYFIGDLVVAGDLLKDILELDQMKIDQDLPVKRIGHVVIGTAAGDLHDIGKNIFGSLLKAAGFNVLDLGIDVSAEDFCKTIIKVKPDILGISGVLTTTFESMKETIEVLKEAGIRDSVKVILGGPECVNPVTFTNIGADAFTNDASKGVQICLSWIK